MICNVCAADARCYELREIVGPPGMMMRAEGMIFSICADCLAKLIEPIKTSGTKVPIPVDRPLSDRAERALAILAKRREL